MSLDKTLEKMSPENLAHVLRIMAKDIEQGGNPGWERFFGNVQKIDDERKQEILQKNNMEENRYWHKVGRSGRSLTHSLNKVLKDWEYNSLRSPRSDLAIIEVAKDCDIDALELATKIIDHPRFGSDRFELKNYAIDLLAKCS